MDQTRVQRPIGVLLVVASFVEAEDLRDAFEHRNLGPVSHEPQAVFALDLLISGASVPVVLVTDDAKSSAGRALMAWARANAVPALILDGAENPGDHMGVLGLMRPYGDADLSMAIAHLLG